MNFRTSRQALRLAIITAIAVILTGLGISSASAQWPPAAPTKVDGCGTKGDRYMAPEDGGVGYYVGGQPIPQGQLLPTNGVSSVIVVAKHWNGSTQSFTLTFGTEPDASCEEAQDAVTMVPSGMCYVDSRDQSRIRVTLALTNTPDTGWQHGYTTVNVRRDGVRVETLNFWNIADGETQSLTSVGDMETSEANQYFEDVRAGTYQFGLIVDDKPEVIQASPVVIAGCGGKNDSPNQGLGGSGSPTAQVIKVTCKMVKMGLNNRGVKSTTAFKVVVKGKGKGKVNRTVAQNKTGKAKVKVKKPRLVKVTANGKVVTKQRLPKKC